MAIIQFKISLLHSQPLIWRRFQVTDNYRMDHFHQVIQIVMGWNNKHLHEFHIGERKIGIFFDGMDDFGAENLEDENTIYLKGLKLKVGDQFRYWYDFGDDWHHLLEVEDLQEGKLALPVILAGEQACPIEDCGGVGSHQDIRNYLKDPSHADYQYWADWVPEDYDPTHFSLKEMNTELTKFGKWHNKHPRAKSTPWHML